MSWVKLKGTLGSRQYTGNRCELKGGWRWGVNCQLVHQWIPSGHCSKPRGGNLREWRMISTFVEKCAHSNKKPTANRFLACTSSIWRQTLVKMLIIWSFIPPTAHRPSTNSLSSLPISCSFLPISVTGTSFLSCNNHQVSTLQDDQHSNLGAAMAGTSGELVELSASTVPLYLVAATSGTSGELVA